MSGVSLVNSGTVFIGRSVVLSTKVTSEPVTALFNVMATDIFCRRYLKISNSIVKNIF